MSWLYLIVCFFILVLVLKLELNNPNVLCLLVIMFLLAFAQSFQLFLLELRIRFIERVYGFNQENQNLITKYYLKK